MGMRVDFLSIATQNFELTHSKTKFKIYLRKALNQLKTFLLGLILITSSLSFAQPLQPHEVPKDIYLDRSGMPELVVTSGLTWSIVTPFLTTTLFTDNVRKGSGFLLGPILGFSLPLILNSGKSLHTNEALTYNFFQQVGLLHGATLPLILNIDSQKGFAGILGAATLAGTAAGILLNPTLQLSPGQASSLTTGLMVGAATGWIALIATSDQINISNRQSTRVILLSANAGALTTYFLRDHLDIDRSRVIWMDIGSILGTGGGFMLGYLLGGENSSTKLLSIMSLAGLYSGLYLGYDLTENMDKYQKSADGASAKSIQFKGPTPTVIPSIDPATGQNSMTFGLNLLNGTW